MVYLDDFLFLARCPRDLIGISEFLSGAGFCLNLEKSVLTPTSDLIFLGIDLDLMAGTARVKAGVLPALRAAVSACSPSWPLLKRQRLAGFVNFVRPCLKLPLEIVSAVRDGDSEACAAVLPFMGDDVMLSHDDVRTCVDVHCPLATSICRRDAVANRNSQAGLHSRVSGSDVRAADLCGRVCSGINGNML